ncbi:MAG: FAD-dependent oxidoreductase, partial [Pseudomonadota bacterium]
MRETKTNALVIGAGIGGLASAALLASAGLSVTVLERQNHAGGKMRTLPSAAGPVDTGPTVLTMKPVFEALFSALGMRLEDHVELIRQKLIARHFWPDGSMLDLFDDEDRSRAAIHAFSGAASAEQFSQFCARARQLFAGFEEPIMRTPEPRLGQLAKYVITRPTLLRAMAPTATLAQLCTKSFDDPRLAQLFGRYATYVGGSPYQAPALLSLIWQAECAGVWVPRGGMAALAHALAAAAEKHGARFIYGADVQEIDVSAGRAQGVTLADGTKLDADCIVFNGDPRALATGLLGSQVEGVARQTARLPRALSAEVWAFAAEAQGPELAHHNVFFRAEPKPEFQALSEGKRVSDPTLYVCAMDRGLPEPSKTLERFEIIANAPPLGL